jgi:adenylylsulfate kinase
VEKQLIWITGLSGAGKTTLAIEVCKQIKKRCLNTVIFDGDAFREISGNDLGHNLEDRIKNAHRIVRMCKYLCDQGLNVVCATMSLYSEIHNFIYNNFECPLVVYLDVPMEELKKRNQKNLYSQGKDLSGIDLPFDKPVHEKYVLNINNSNISDTVNKIIRRLEL